MASEPTTIAEIVARTVAAASAFDAALEAIPGDRVGLPLTADGWSARDIVMHIAVDLRWFAGQLAATLEERVPTDAECYGHEEVPGPGDDMATPDGRNAWHYRINADVPFDEARRREMEWRQQLLDVLQLVPDSELGRSYTIADLGAVGQVRPAAEGEWGVPLKDWIRGATWHHYEDHGETLREIPSS